MSSHVEHKLRSILQYFTAITTIGILSFALLMGWVGWTHYNARMELITLRLESQTARITRSLTDAIDYTSYILERVNNQVRPIHTNVAAINKVLRSFKVDNKQASDVLALSLFSWVNANHQLVANSEKGILPVPKDLAQREYILLTRKAPQQLQIGPPVAGMNNARWVIPLGMGIMDEQDHYLGASVVGLDLTRLMQHWQKLTIPGISFALLDMDWNVIITSQHQPFPSLSHLFPTLDKLDLASSASGLLQKASFLTGKENFIYYQKSKYPYLILVSYDKRLSDAEIREALFSYLLEFFIIGLFILVLLLGIRNYILSPILALSSIANTIAKGEKAHNFPEAKTLEIQALSDQLKKVVDYTSKLRTAQHELLLAHERVKLANESLEQKVVERTKVLEQTLQAKTDFINNISHEVRSPIQGVTVISGGLVDDWEHLPEAKRFSYAQEIHKSGERLLDLVNSLLDFSKLNAGKMEFAMVPYTNLTAVAEDIIQECKLLVGKKPVSLLLDAPHSMPAEFDRQRIGQVLRNLLANAIKFTPKGAITVCLSHRPFNRLNGELVQGVAVTVADEGIGIPEEELEHIFQPFAQSSLTKSRAGGTGLGLTICHEIITAHHGIIYAACNEKKGASFTFIIPLEQPLISMERSLPTMLTENANDNINILIVDDEIHCLISMRIILEGQGYNIIEAESGTEALATLNAHPDRIDVILLDLMMPDMYGTEVLLAIRQDERFQHIPVIIQSGAANDIEINKALQSGACSHIRKPYNRAMLLETIGEAMQEKVI